MIVRIIQSRAQVNRILLNDNSVNEKGQQLIRCTTSGNRIITIRGAICVR